MGTETGRKLLNGTIASVTGIGSAALLVTWYDPQAYILAVVFTLAVFALFLELKDARGDTDTTA